MILFLLSLYHIISYLITYSSLHIYSLISFIIPSISVETPPLIYFLIHFILIAYCPNSDVIIYYLINYYMSPCPFLLGSIEFLVVSLHTFAFLVKISILFPKDIFM